MRSYQRFLLLLGAVFVPLLGVLVADWLLRGLHYTREDVFDAPPLRPGCIVAWIVGFFVYEWLYQPTDLGFWSRWLGELWTPKYQIGASVPSFVVAFLLTAATVWLGSAVPQLALVGNLSRTSLTAARRASAAARSTRPVPGGRSAHERRSTHAAAQTSGPSTRGG
jgi:hypothetical protein